MSLLVFVHFFFVRTNNFFLVVSTKEFIDTTEYVILASSKKFLFHDELQTSLILEEEVITLLPSISMSSTALFIHHSNQPTLLHSTIKLSFSHNFNHRYLIMDESPLKRRKVSSMLAISPSCSSNTKKIVTHYAAFIGNGTMIFIP